jgi:hypothetical protein
MRDFDENSITVAVLQRLAAQRIPGSATSRKAW